MGGNSSIQKSVQINKSVKNIVNSSIQRFTSNTSASASSVQSLKITFGPTSITDCSNLNISQNAQVELGARLKTMINQSANISTDIATNVAAQAAAKAAQENKDLNLFQVNASKQIQDIATDVYESVLQTTQTYITKNIKFTSSSQQDLVLVFNGKLDGFGCNINQTSGVKLIVDDITTAILDNISKLKSVTDLKTKVDQASSQKNIGLDVYKILIVVAVIILLLIIGYVLINVLKPTPKMGGFNPYLQQQYYPPQRYQQVPMSERPPPPSSQPAPQQRIPSSQQK